MKATASDLVRAIHHLPRNRTYHYVSGKTRTQLLIHSVDLPDFELTLTTYSHALQLPVWLRGEREM